MTSPSAAVTSVIIFTDDATELSFSDGAKLELSPCGASFVCERLPSRGQHPLGGGTRIMQRTEFTTSQFRDKVYQALECRNRFAECPYLCQQFLLDGSVLQLFADIKVVKWTKDSDKVSWKLQPNGTVQVTSVDECASLFLSANKQEFTVEFLCRLSQNNISKKLSRHAKLVKQSGRNSGDIGRPSTDLDFGSDCERTACDDDCLKHSSNYGCMQESPYLQTLIPGKVPLALGESPEDAENHRHPHFRKQTVSLKTYPGKAEDINFPSHDQVNKVQQVEELIAIKHGYTWVIQHHTVEHCPECWKQPLFLALNFDPKVNLSTSLSEKRPKTSFEGTTVLKTSVKHRSSPELLPTESTLLKDHNTKEKDMKVESERKSSDKTSRCQPESLLEDITSPLPSSLPLACPASHLHRWRMDGRGDRTVDLVEEDIPVGRNIKVWFSNGIIYRLSRTPQPAVHIYPGDGTLIKSTGSNGGFFTHIIPRGDSLDERMLCVRSPPPDCPGSAYSIAGVLRKASRLLQNMVQADLSWNLREGKCCWKNQLLSCPLTSPKPTVVLEESKVDGLGQFVAFSNGMVRVVFDDRTTLDMEWDFRNRVTGNYSDEVDSQSLPSHHEASKQSSKIRKSFFASGLQQGSCQLLLPHGEYKLVSVDDPQEYYRYVVVAVEWATWVASSPAKRVNFYSSQEPQLSQQNWYPVAPGWREAIPVVYARPGNRSALDRNQPRTITISALTGTHLLQGGEMQSQ